MERTHEEKTKFGISMEKLLCDTRKSKSSIQTIQPKLHMSWLGDTWDRLWKRLGKCNNSYGSTYFVFHKGVSSDIIRNDTQIVWKHNSSQQISHRAWYVITHKIVYASYPWWVENISKSTMIQTAKEVFQPLDVSNNTMLSIKMKCILHLFIMPPTIK